MVAKGRIVWVSGPAVKADGMSAAKMYETVEVGESKLIGEVISVQVIPRPHDDVESILKVGKKSK